MDVSSEAALQMLKALIVGEVRLFEFAHKLRASPSVAHVDVSLRPRLYRLEGEWAGFEGVIEGWADAELKDGGSIVGLLDVHINSHQWRIVSRIAITDDKNNQKVAKEFADRTAVTLSQFFTEFELAISDLTSDTVEKYLTLCA